MSNSTSLSAFITIAGKYKLALAFRISSFDISRSNIARIQYWNLKNSCQPQLQQQGAFMSHVANEDSYNVCCLFWLCSHDVFPIFDRESWMLKQEIMNSNQNTNVYFLDRYLEMLQLFIISFAGKGPHFRVLLGEMIQCKDIFNAKWPDIL